MRKNRPNTATLLLGASGKVGKMLLASPAFQKERIVPQYRIAPMRHTNEYCLWEPLEISGELPSIFDEIQSIVVMSGATAGTESQLRINEELAERCCSIAHSRGLQKVLLASSSAVYGMSKNRALLESDPLVPANAYGASKARMEKIGLKWRALGLDVCSLRIGNVVGAGSFFSRAQEPQKKQIVLDTYPNGSGAIRNFIGTNTLGDVIAQLLKKTSRLPASLNVGMPTPISMDALADAFGIQYQRQCVASSNAQNITLNVEKLAEIYKFPAYEDVGNYLANEWREVNREYP